MFFSNTHQPQLTAPFYSILFETSICQFNSSKCSPIMPDGVIEHLIRDQRPFLHPESLQILQIHSSMTVLLLFSSPHSFSTGFRSEDWMAIAEAWFCAQWPISVLFLRFVFGLLYGWKIQTWPYIHTYIHTYTHTYFFLHFLFNKFCIKVIIKITLKNWLEKYLYYVSYYFALQKKKCFFNNLTTYNIYRTKQQKKNMEKKARGGKKRKIYAYKINV